MPRFLCAFLVATALSGAEPSVPAHIRNFGEVNSTIFRGGEPSPTGLQELSGFGVRLVIDLREAGSATVREQTEVEHLGMHYVNVPLSPWSAPAPDEVNTVLSMLLHAGPEPIFVHCRRGKDRTGTVIACYRIQHDRWDNLRALAEAQEFGMSRAERSMRSFILHFSPLPLVASH
ncbi:MAG: tyrosine-protein phosphatase [Acidobacteriota bacterium]|nr:tyrosine-protein phosphatase [Acidobacteriota bacterium]